MTQMLEKNTLKTFCNTTECDIVRGPLVNPWKQPHEPEDDDREDIRRTCRLGKWF